METWSYNPYYVLWEGAQKWSNGPTDFYTFNAWDCSPGAGCTNYQMVDSNNQYIQYSPGQEIATGISQGGGSTYDCNYWVWNSGTGSWQSLGYMTMTNVSNSTPVIEVDEGSWANGDGADIYPFNDQFFSGYYSDGTQWSYFPTFTGESNGTSPTWAPVSGNAANGGTLTVQTSSAS